VSITRAIGLGPSSKLATERRVLKGYAKSRYAYDFRRRLSQTREETREYKLLVRRDPCIVCAQTPERGRVQDVDHIIPLIKGGEDEWTNMAAACRRCNRGRRERPLLLYLLSKNGA
jgi:5-methylcytosine-specific restriction endonuclease McrA